MHAQGPEKEEHESGLMAFVGAGEPCIFNLFFRYGPTDGFKSDRIVLHLAFCVYQSFRFFPTKRSECSRTAITQMPSPRGPVRTWIRHWRSVSGRRSALGGPWHVQGTQNSQSSWHEGFLG